MFSPLRESGASAKMNTSHAMKENQWHVIIRCEYVILNNRGARTNSSTDQKKKKKRSPEVFENGLIISFAKNPEPSMISAKKNG